jgi:hypothetical protein
VVTNLAPDHLDRYPDLASYYADKARLFEQRGHESVWVLNGEDPAVLDPWPGDAPGRGCCSVPLRPRLRERMGRGSRWRGSLVVRLGGARRAWFGPTS